MNEQQFNQRVIRNYQILETIGKGGFSIVMKAIHIPTNVPVAIKITKKDRIQPDKYDREVSIVKHLDHPFLVSFYDFFSDDENYYIVMEYVHGGDIRWIINNQGALPEDEVHHYFSQLITVIDYLHSSLHVVHRDLKGENIMLDQNNNIRVIDFDLGNTFDAEMGLLSTACGSPSYAPPEMFRQQEYTTSADIWSCGVVLYAMAYGRLPFEEKNIQKLASQIVLDEPAFPNTISSSLIDLIQKLLTKDPSSRIQISAIKSHPWFTSYPSLTLDPSLFIYKYTPSSKLSPNQYPFSNLDYNKFSENSDLSCSFQPDPAILSQMNHVEIDRLTNSMQNYIFDNSSSIYRILFSIQNTKKLGELALNSLKSNCSGEGNLYKKPISLKDRKLPSSLRSSKPGLGVLGQINMRTRGASERSIFSSPGSLNSGLPTGVQISTSNQQNVGIMLAFNGRRNISTKKPRSYSTGVV